MMKENKHKALIVSTYIKRRNLRLNTDNIPERGKHRIIMDNKKQKCSKEKPMVKLTYLEVASCCPQRPS
jgi:hypothetical protein